MIEMLKFSHQRRNKYKFEEEIQILKPIIEERNDIFHQLQRNLTAWWKFPEINKYLKRLMIMLFREVSRPIYSQVCFGAVNTL